jgi:clan AA aspartic protease
MGLVYIDVGISNPAHPKKMAKAKFLVDSGALYSVVSEKVLSRLGIKPESKMTFTLANGETVERKIGNALFQYQGKRRASPVIFGESGDSTLLGTVTLEALGFILDPLRRELRPLPMILA